MSCGGVIRRVRSSSGRTSSTWRAKQLLVSAMAVGGLSFFAAGGTFGLLSSQESNKGASISSGTLTLSNVVNAGTACFSYGGPASPGNVNNTCQALVVSSSLNYPGQPRTATVTVTNNGSLDASDLSVYMPSCTNVATPLAPNPGGGNPCASGGAQLYIQETVGTTNTCLYPAAAGACSFVASTLYLFALNRSTAASALHLGATAHGLTRTFTIGLQLPSDAANTLQGQAAQFGLTWRITS
jgi:hypothetical protein